MHGLGNDFAVFDCRDGAPTPDPALLHRLANRRRGIGFDQALLLAAPNDPASIASYRIVNADGSEVQQCGNGVRCIALLLALRDRSIPMELQLDSPAGAVRARVESPHIVAVDMGEPDFRPASLPFRNDSELPHYTLDIGGRSVTFQVVSIGNPHAVLWVDDVDAADVGGLGPVLGNHPAFPERCNVGFAERVSAERIRLRVFERGVGETPACGTGACAAVVAGQRLGQLDDTVTVSLPGGQLVVSWRGGAEPVWLTGNAELISEGKIDL